jgi:ribosomal protein S18 acetylase RimI-like enzyme
MTGRTNIRPAIIADAPAMAHLHVTEIDEGFLPTLGDRFLGHLYRRVVRSPSSFAFVAVDDDAVVGFAAGADNLRELYRSFVLHDGVVAVVAAGPRIARSWRRVVETLRYPAHDGADLPPAELIAIAVGHGAQGRGLGRDLVDAVTTEFTRRGITAARVVAGADNEAALRLYRACGFRTAATVQVHRGTASEVLTWS